MNKNYIFIALTAILIIYGCNKPEPGPEKTERVTRRSVTMGTTIEIQIITDSVDKANRAITSAFEEIRRINDKYSTYREKNYMTDINSNDTFALDDETEYLVNVSDEIYAITEGRFDIAVGNLIKLTGFESDNPHLASRDSIIEALAETGSKYLDYSNLPILVRRNNVKINFGGIAKGYAVDRAAEIIAESGFETYMVNAGGEIRAAGKIWNVGISHPRKRGELLGRLELEDAAVATSGDYEQFFKKGGKRYTHIIDPVSGIPSDNCQAVSVVSDKCIYADGIATGLFILGPEKSIELVNALDGIECMVVDKNGKVIKSANFDDYFRE